MKITIEVSEQKIIDQLIAAVEGGSTYWCKSLTVLNRDSEKPEPLSYEAVLAGTQAWKVKEYDPSGLQCMAVTKESLEKALHVLAAQYPRFLKDIQAETGDAYTGDALLQCAVFGDMIYG